MDRDKAQLYSVLSNSHPEATGAICPFKSQKATSLLLKRKKYLKLLTHGRPSTSDIKQIFHFLKFFINYIFGRKEYEIALCVA